MGEVDEVDDVNGVDTVDGRAGGGPPRPLRPLRSLLVALALIVAHDLWVSNHLGFGARAAIFAIDQYRARVSPRISGVVKCRFTPSCSAYGREAIRKHGLAVGGAKTAWRIARCGPWTSPGTIDLP